MPNAKLKGYVLSLCIIAEDQGYGLRLKFKTKA
jgi:hypothetical protein